MKKIIKKSILAATSLISVGGTAATVASCAATPEDKKEDINDEAVNNFKKIVEELGQELNGIALTFEADREITSTMFLTSINDVLSNFYDNEYYSDIDFSNVTIIGNPEENVVTNTEENTTDGVEISYEISLSSIKDPKIKASHIVDTTYDLSGRVEKDKQIGSLEEWNEVLESMRLSFTETEDHKFTLNEPATKGWPKQSGLDQAIYVYSTNGTNWITDRTKIPLLDYSTTVYVSIRANMHYYIGEYDTLAAKPFTTPDKPAPIEDVSIGSLEEWNKVIESLTIRFSETEDHKFTLEKPTMEGSWPNGTTVDQAHYVYSLDDKTWTDNVTEISPVGYSTTVYVSIRANQGFQIGNHETPNSKSATTIKTLGTVESWTPIVDSISLKFNYDNTSKTYNGNTPGTKQSWPNRAGLDQAHYEYSLDNKTFSNDINIFSNLAPKSTVYVAIRANTGYEFEGGKLLDAKTIAVPDAPVIEIGSTQTWQGVVDSIIPEFHYNGDEATYTVSELPYTGTLPNESADKIHFEYSLDNIDFSNDIATLSKLQMSSKIYIRIAANEGYRIGSTNEPLKAREIQVPANAPWNIADKNQVDSVVDTINIKFIDNGDGTRSHVGNPTSKGWPEYLNEHAHYVYSIDGINFTRNIDILKNVPNNSSMFISIRADSGYKILYSNQGLHAKEFLGTNKLAGPVEDYNAIIDGLSMTFNHDTNNPEYFSIGSYKFEKVDLNKVHWVYSFDGGITTKVLDWTDTNRFGILYFNRSEHPNISISIRVNEGIHFGTINGTTNEVPNWRTFEVK